MTEILDLYNENGEPTGGTVLRGTPVPHGYYLMLVSIMTLRSDGRFLITKRAPEKKYAGRWEITGGCVQSGETAAEGALRELREETGITASAAELTECGTDRRSGYIHCFFLIHKDVPEDAVVLQPGETDAYRWVTPAVYRALMRKGRTIPHHNPMILSHYGILFGDKKQRSSL